MTTRSLSASIALQHLLALGISEDQIFKSSLSLRNPGPFLDEQPIRPHPSIDSNLYPRALSPLRHVLIDQLVHSEEPAFDRYRRQAWDTLAHEDAQAQAKPELDVAREFRSRQRTKAQMPRRRNLIPLLNMTQKEVVEELCSKPEHRDRNSDELWEPLWAYLDENALSVEEVGDTYEFQIDEAGNRDVITKSRFARYVGSVRKARTK